MNLEIILFLLLCVSTSFIFKSKIKLEDLKLQLKRCQLEHKEKLADINTKIISNLFDNVATEFQNRDAEKFKSKVHTLYKKGETILSEIYPNGYCPTWDSNEFVQDFFSWHDSFEDGRGCGNISKKYIKITPNQLKEYSDGELDALMNNLFFIITVKAHGKELDMEFFFYNTYVIRN